MVGNEPTQVVIDGTPALQTALNTGGKLVFDTGSPDGNVPDPAQIALQAAEARAMQIRMVRRAIALAKRQAMRAPMKAKRKLKNRARNKMARQSRKRNK